VELTALGGRHLDGQVGEVAVVVADDDIGLAAMPACAAICPRDRQNAAS